MKVKVALGPNFPHPSFFIREEDKTTLLDQEHPEAIVELPIRVAEYLETLMEDGFLIVTREEQYVEGEEKEKVREPFTRIEVYD